MFFVWFLMTGVIVCENVSDMSHRLQCKNQDPMENFRSHVTR